MRAFQPQENAKITEKSPSRNGGQRSADTLVRLGSRTPRPLDTKGRARFGLFALFAFFCGYYVWLRLGRGAFFCGHEVSLT